MADVYFYKNIEFDINGSFTMDFLTSSGNFSETLRNNYFSGTRFFASITDSNIYIREDAPTRIAYNIDALRSNGVNYIKYRNLDPVNNTFSRWYYAFIENLEYIDANTTAMYIKIDVLQTYMAELYSSTKEQFIERCHQKRYDANGMPIFNTLKDLPAGESETSPVKSFEPENDIVYYLVTAKEQMSQSLEDDSWLVSSTLKTPNTVQNIANAFFYYIIPGFKTINGHTNDRFFVKISGTDYPLISAFNFSLGGDPPVIFNLHELLKPDTSKIISISLLSYPPFNISFRKSANSLGGYNYYYNSSDGSVNPVKKSLSVLVSGLFGASLKVTDEKPTSMNYLGNFKTVDFIDTKTNRTYNQNSARDPLRESKLYSFDYTKFYFTDYNEQKEIKAEHITADPDTNTKLINFYSVASVTGDVITSVKFYNYESPGNTLKYVTDFRNKTTNEIPFLIDSYSEFLHNKAVGRVAGILSDTVSGAVGGAGRKARGGMSAAGLGAFQGYISSTADFIADAIGEWAKLETPATLADAAALKLTLGYNGFMIFCEFPLNYKPICDFWNCNGYPLDETRKLNDIITTRYWFNFIKTVDAQLTNVSFTPHRLQLEALLNNGVRFWHNRNGNFQPFNDYSLENAEV